MNLYLRLFVLLFRLIGLRRKGVFEESRVAFVKGLFLDRDGKVASSTVAAELGYTGAPPPMPEELRIWAELHEAKKQKA